MDFKINTVSSKKKILLSSSAILYDKDAYLYIKIINTFNDEDYLGIRFEFQEDSSESRRTFIKGVTDTSDVVISCINYKSNVATKKAILIGWFEDDISIVNIYVHFWVQQLNDESTRKIDYTIFAEDVQKNG